MIFETVLRYHIRKNDRVMQIPGWQESFRSGKNIPFHAHENISH